MTDTIIKATLTGSFSAYAWDAFGEFLPYKKIQLTTDTGKVDVWVDMAVALAPYDKNNPSVIEGNLGTTNDFYRAIGHEPMGEQPILRQARVTGTVPRVS